MLSAPLPEFGTAVPIPGLSSVSSWCSLVGSSSDPGHKHGRCLIEILVADGERRRTAVLLRILAAHKVRLASEAATACRAIEDRIHHLVFLDQSLGGTQGAETVVRSLVDRSDPPPVILHGTDKSAAMRFAGQLPRAHVFPLERLQKGSIIHSRLQTLFAPGIWVPWDSIRSALRDP